MTPLDFSDWEALRAAAKYEGMSVLHVQRDWLVALLVGRCYLDLSEVRALRVAQLDLYGRQRIKPIVRPFRLARTQSVRPRLVLLDAETYFTGRAYAQSLRRAGRRLTDHDAAIRSCRWPFPRPSARTLQHGFRVLSQSAGLGWSLTELRMRALAALSRHADAHAFSAISGLDVRAYYRYQRAVKSCT